MLGNESTACNVTQAINTASLSAGATNGTWIDTSNIQGDLTFVIGLGAVTGSCVVKVQDATSSGGAGSADVTGYTTAALSTANTATKLVMPSTKSRGFVRLVSTVTTGPILTSAILIARPNTTA